MTEAPWSASPRLHLARLSDAAAWDAIQAASGIPSHSRHYAAALALCGIRPELALIEGAGGLLAIPFHERRFRDATDACTWLSLSGAAGRAPLAPLLPAWEGLARQRGWVASYIQIAPDTPVADLPQAIPHHAVFLLDLAQPDPLAGAARTIREKIRCAEAAGVVLVEDRAALAAALQRIHPAAMARVGASAAYAFPPAMLDALAAAPDALVLGAAASPAGAVESVLVCPFFGTRAEYLIGVSTAEGRELSAWLVWQAMLRLRALGVRQFNLGGGVRPGDGIARFKSWFGGAERPLHALRLIHDPARYRALCEATGARPDARWFPAYRDPALQAGP